MTDLVTVRNSTHILHLVMLSVFNLDPFSFYLHLDIAELLILFLIFRDHCVTDPPLS